MRGGKFVILSLIAAVGALDDAEIDPSTFSRVVVIPDVHGDRDAFVRSLWLAQKVVDGAAIDFDHFNATFMQAIDGGDAAVAPLSASENVAFVQLGDLVDRGPHSVACVAVADQVRPLLGWRTTRLYGNHETMTISGLFDHYAHPDEVAGFGGNAERRASYAPGGEIHGHLVDRFLGVARLSDRGGKGTLFVHGGLHSDWLWQNVGYASDSVADINTIVRDSVVQGGYEMEKLHEENSPVWMRELATGDEDEICDVLQSDILDLMEVDRIVLGHTPQYDGYVTSRCGGRILLADVAMSRWMRDPREYFTSRPMAMIFSYDESGALQSIVAHYTDLPTGTIDETQVLFEARVHVARDDEVEDGEIVDEPVVVQAGGAAVVVAEDGTDSEADSSGSVEDAFDNDAMARFVEWYNEHWEEVVGLPAAGEGARDVPPPPPVSPQVESRKRRTETESEEIEEPAVKGRKSEEPGKLVIRIRRNPVTGQYSQM